MNRGQTGIYKGMPLGFNPFKLLFYLVNPLKHDIRLCVPRIPITVLALWFLVKRRNVHRIIWKADAAIQVRVLC